MCIRLLSKWGGGKVGDARLHLRASGGYALSRHKVPKKIFKPIYLLSKDTKTFWIRSFFRQNGITPHFMRTCRRTKRLMHIDIFTICLSHLLSQVLSHEHAHSDVPTVTPRTPTYVINHLSTSTLFNQLCFRRRRQLSTAAQRCPTEANSTN